MAVPFTAREPVEYTPLTLPEKLAGEGEDGLKKFAILVRVPTHQERDSYHAALVRSGVVNYTRSQIRDLAIAGVADLYGHEGEEAVEAKVALLQESWQVQDEEAKAEQEQMRVLMELHEAAKEESARTGKEVVPDPEVVKKALAEIIPTQVMDRKRRAEAMALNHDILSRYPMLQNALASLTEQNAKQAYMNAEVYVAGWRGLEFTPVGNGHGGILKHEVEYLRSQIGDDGFQELSMFITSLMGIDQDEEKNLASLLENMSAQIGSTQSESKASSEDGNSTGGHSGETPAAVSPKATEPSSGSSTKASTKTGKSTRGRTGARS